MPTELELKNSLSSTPASLLSEDKNSTESTPLCSYYAQVVKPKHNPYYVRELCKENVVNWLAMNSYSDI